MSTQTPQTPQQAQSKLNNFKTSCLSIKNDGTENFIKVPVRDYQHLTFIHSALITAIKFVAMAIEHEPNEAKESCYVLRGLYDLMDATMTFDENTAIDELIN